MATIVLLVEVSINLHTQMWVPHLCWLALPISIIAVGRACVLPAFIPIITYLFLSLHFSCSVRPCLVCAYMSCTRCDQARQHVACCVQQDVSSAPTTKHVCVAGTREHSSAAGVLVSRRCSQETAAPKAITGHHHVCVCARACCVRPV